jgi:hypothetical protein
MKPLQRQRPEPGHFGVPDRALLEHRGGYDGYRFAEGFAKVVGAAPNAELR